jgi:hypothetical protein
VLTLENIDWTTLTRSNHAHKSYISKRYPTAWYCVAQDDLDVTFRRPASIAATMSVHSSPSSQVHRLIRALVQRPTLRLIGTIIVSTDTLRCMSARGVRHTRSQLCKTSPNARYCTTRASLRTKTQHALYQGCRSQGVAAYETYALSVSCALEAPADCTRIASYRIYGIRGSRTTVTRVFFLARYKYVDQRVVF